MRHWGFFDRGSVKVAGACLLSALLGFAAGNGHTTRGAVTSLSDRLGKATALANCEDRRGRQLERVARQAIVANAVEAVPTPSTGEIPRDCPHRGVAVK